MAISNKGELERRKWAKSKNVFIDRLQEETGKLLTVFAGRGFSRPPGVMLEGLSLVGLVIKKSLAEANTVILGESIEIELEEIQHDNTIAIGEAHQQIEADIQALLLAWELEKDTILNQFALSEQTIALARAELDKREGILIDGRAAIQEALDILELRLVEIERMPLGKERELVVAQIETAKEKLKVIPLLLALLIEERTLIDEKRLTLEKRLELLPGLRDIADAEIDFVEKAREVVVARRDMIPPRRDLIAAQRGVLDKEEDVITKRQRLTELETELQNVLITRVAGREDVRNEQMLAADARREIVRQDNLLKNEEEMTLEKTGDINEAEADLSDDRSDLLDARGKTLDQYDELLDVRNTVLNAERVLLEDLKERQPELIRLRTAAALAISEAEIEKIIGAQLELILERGSLDIVQIENQTTLATVNSDNIQAMAAERANIQADQSGVRTQSATLNRLLREVVSGVEADTGEETNTISVDATKEMLDVVGLNQRTVVSKEALIRALSNVTAQVVQTIGA